MHYDLLIRGGTCVTPCGTRIADLAISDGAIASVNAQLSDTANHTIDATGLHVLPGVIDSQVHF